MNARADAVQPVQWVRVGRIADIPLRGARRVSSEKTTIAVFRTADERVFALEDRCPHRGGPLSQGIVHGECVTCPLHNWVIGLDNGVALGPDEGQVRRFATRVDDGEVWLSLLEEP